MSKKFSFVSTIVLSLVLGACSSQSVYREPASEKRISNGVERSSSLTALEIPPLEGPVQLITMPQASTNRCDLNTGISCGHSEFVQYIAKARNSIDMMMFHLSDPQVVTALVRALNRNVKVRIIVDRNLLKGSKTGQASMNQLNKIKADTVRPSSPSFDLTHAKSMIIDNQYAFVTSINLTDTATNTRDVGLITQDTSIIAEMEKVFEADWEIYNQNITGPTTGDGKTSGPTPDLSQPNLIWSPVDSEEKIIQLISSTKKSLNMTVENLGNKNILDALIEVSSYAPVRIIVPECNEGVGYNQVTYNYQFIKQMLDAANDGKHDLSIHVMKSPANFSRPYMHQKMIISDGRKVYFGSENFSDHSLFQARELGIYFTDIESPSTIANKILETFNSDWGTEKNGAWSPSYPAPTTAPAACGSPNTTKTVKKARAR